jgi:hypothetical protein
LNRLTPYVRSLYIFNALSLVGGIVYGLYYGIFLYKSTFSLTVLALDGLLGGFGVWFGYLLGVVAIKKVGYSLGFKVTFGTWAFIAVITALVANNIAEWFMILAILKGIPAGMYTSLCDAIMLREIGKTTRNSFLQIKLALEFLAGVVLPVLVGALVVHGSGYKLSFVIAGVIYMVGILIPVSLPKPEVSFSWREVFQTFKKPLYPKHAANRTASAGFNQINAFVLMIIPFLMLKNEMKVGFLTSGIALVAALMSLAVRKIKTGQKLKFAFGAYTMRALISMTFVVLWKAPVLMVWQLVNKLATPFHDPLQQGLDIHNDSLIMGTDVQAKALNINVLNNTLILAGTTAAYGAFFFITRAANGQQRFVLELLILSFAAWRFVNLLVSVKINNKAQTLSYAPYEVPMSLRLWRYLGLNVMKLRFSFARYKYSESLS